jgi:hypothetical protein
MLIGLQKHPYRWVGLAQRVAVAALHIWAILVCWSLIEVPASGHEAVE